MLVKQDIISNAMLVVVCRLFAKVPIVVENLKMAKIAVFLAWCSRCENTIMFISTSSSQRTLRRTSVSFKVTIMNHTHVVQ